MIQRLKIKILFPHLFVLPLSLKFRQLSFSEFLLIFGCPLSTTSTPLSVKSLNRYIFFVPQKNVLTPAALKSGYYALVHSHFIYGIQIWSSTTASNLNGLFLKQKIAIRLINSEMYNAHTEPLFKKSNILPLHMLVDYFKLQFFHRFTINDLPHSFENTWIKNEERRQENAPLLRNHLEYHVPYSRLSSTEKFPLICFPRLWCSFSDINIKSTVNKSSFNIQLKNYFLNSLSATYTCTRLLCPRCHLQV